jgi:hypothetical protein
MLLCETAVDVLGAIPQVIRISNSLAVLYAATIRGQLEKLYSENEHSDMKRTTRFVVGRTKAKWFTENYLSTTRHTTSVHGLKAALRVLSASPEYQSVRNELVQLAALQVNMDNKFRQEHEISYSGHTSTIAGLLPVILSKMAKITKNPQQADGLNAASRKLSTSVTELQALWDRLHSKWEQENPDESKPTKTKPVKDASIGQQLSQADQMVAQILSSLPDKKVAHEIRTNISRSDNKLQALLAEFTKRGIKM